jgi:hypothetical protein
MSKILFTVIAFLFSASLGSAAEKLIWKTETDFAKELGPLGECKPDDSACQEADHVGYKKISHYGRTYFLTYEEAVRAYVSFDAPLDVNRDAQQVFASDQLAPGAFDWGGVMDGAKFKPLYVIKRFYDPKFDYSYDKVNQKKSGLFVWRLSRNLGQGSSIMIGMAGGDTAKARKFADRDFVKMQK